ncbi:hypothetical protein BGX33_009069 [Mortierella sp. NVP41]|nr:hypothetical protein BGX33_009069 [Mortierella sp. NVP41]
MTYIPNTSPINIPEVLESIFLHLDRPSLLTCTRVSRLWRLWSLHVLSEAFVASEDIVDYFARREASTMSTDTQARALNAFIDRAPEIQALTVGDCWRGNVPVDDSANQDQVQETLPEVVLPPGLINLRRLDLRMFSPLHFSFDDYLPSHLTQQLLHQNPLIDDFQYSSYSIPGCETLAEVLRRVPLTHLKRLSVHCEMGHAGYTKLLIALTMRDRYQEEDRKQELGELSWMAGVGEQGSHHQQQQRRYLTSCINEGGPDRWEHISARLAALPNWDLEELVVRNIVHPDRRGPGNNPPLDGFIDYCNMSSTVRRPLSIKNLTIVDSEALRYTKRVYVETETVLYHIADRVPLLECLRISPDSSKLRSPHAQCIGDRIRELYPGLDRDKQKWVPPSEDGALGRIFTRFCPNLKVIDLSHQQSVSRHDWAVLLRAYSRQLESLVAWNVELLGPRQLMQSVPPSPAILRIVGLRPVHAWSGLQELDISANSSLGCTVHMFLKYAPSLRILRALGVPVNATRLVGFDWVCTNMEVLAINVVVPREALPPSATTWCWDRNRNRWDTIFDSKESPANFAQWLTSEGGSVTRESMRTDSAKEIQDATIEMIEIQADDCSSSTVEDRGGDGSDTEDGGEGSILRRQRKQQKLFLRWKAAEDAKEQWNRDIQVQICQQLGRLTKLRELTLEGYQGNVDDRNKKLIDCLHLTLETGLDYLRPLQANLEKMVVYQLDEELCGRAEMKWIAQHWVHHDNPVWQNEFQAWKASNGQADMDVDKCQNEGRHPSLSFPKFKELHGINVCGRVGGRSGRRAEGNVSWFERLCPRLVVVKDRAQSKSRTRVDLENM